MLLSPNAMGRPLRTGLYLTTGVIAAFLLLPVVFIVLLSFGSSQWLVFPPPGWTFKWYGQFFSNAQWMDSALVSLKVALLTTVCALAIGLPSAFALVRSVARLDSVLAENLPTAHEADQITLDYAYWAKNGAQIATRWNEWLVK